MQVRKDMSRMFPEHLFLGLIGLFSGLAVSAGTFAFLLVIGVVPRMLRRMHQNRHILAIETVIIAGIVTGCVLSLWNGAAYADGMIKCINEYGKPAFADQILWNSARMLAHFTIVLYGLSAGIFVGCVAIALAEILHTFPIIFRRLKLKRGLELLIFAMAFGKLLGSLFSFLGGYRF